MELGEWGTLGHTTILHEALRANSARSSSGGDAMLGSMITEVKGIQCLQREQKDGENMVCNLQVEPRGLLWRFRGGVSSMEMPDLGHHQRMNKTSSGYKEGAGRSLVRGCNIYLKSLEWFGSASIGEELAVVAEGLSLIIMLRSTQSAVNPSLAVLTNRG